MREAEKKMKKHLAGNLKRNQDRKSPRIIIRSSLEILTALYYLITWMPEIPRLFWALQRPNPDTTDKADAYRGDARKDEMLLAFSRASI